MKKILLLGGSAQQVVAIETAKKLGYYTVLCDYLPDNPGQYAADKFYLVSTTDMQNVLQIARDEQIDGVVAYASDPAAPTAAYVAEMLNLPGNPYEAVDILCNKDKFRKFLKENGFCTPNAQGFTDADAAITAIESQKFQFPLIIKPVDSSGSKGVTVLQNVEKAQQAVAFAFDYSRSKRIVVEEFIEKKHPYLIGGDIFVLDGQIVLWGLLNCHRDACVNSLVPIGKSYPLMLEDADLIAVKQTLQDLVDKTGIRCCAMNVELVVDRNGKVWPIDIGPRNGGNMIPELLGYIFDVNVVEMTIQAAMGEKISLEKKAEHLFYATHNLHTAKNGIFEGVKYSQVLSKYILRSSIYKKPGDAVEYFDNAAKALGIVFLKFPDGETMQHVLANINEHINIQVQCS